MRQIRLALAVATAGLVFGVWSHGVMADESSTDEEDRQEQQIRVRLQRAPELRNNQIHVDVDDGIALLEGTMDTEAEKMKSTQLAHVDGILGVNNRLEVRRPAK